jgi:hypothetical protein
MQKVYLQRKVARFAQRDYLAGIMVTVAACSSLALT